MWARIADLILRFRIPLLILVIGASAGLGWLGVTRAEFIQEFVNIIPNDDPNMREYAQFKAQFGEDGTTFLVGLEGPDNWDYRLLNTLDSLATRLEGTSGVRSVAGVVRAQTLATDTARQRFVLQPVAVFPLASQQQADSLRNWFLQQPFYRGLLFSPDLKVHVLAVSFADTTMRSKAKHGLMRGIEDVLNSRIEQLGIQVHPLYAGLPYVRTWLSRTLPGELGIFTVVALLFTALALFLFYRSVYAMVFPLVLLILSAVVTLGIIALFGYKITVLMSMLPPVIIVLGIPPSIYMLSDYHEEYVRTGNKLLALRNMVRKLGLVTLMINANTAFGFLTLYFTNVTMLEEFGLVAFTATMAAYVLTLILIPGIYSLLPAPTERHVKHLEAPRINALVRWVARVVQHRRRQVYAVTLLITGLGLGGTLLLVAESHMVDDVPRSANVYTNFVRMQQAFRGVMPFEMVIDTRENLGSQKLKWLKKVDALQQRLRSYPEVARTVSIVDAVKWGRQALAGGDSAAYQLPVRDEYDLVQLYAANARGMDSAQAPGSDELGTLSNGFTDDSTRRLIRISGFVEDVGSRQMPELMARIQRDVDSIFGIARTEPVTAELDTLPAATEATMPGTILTGTTRIFLKANEYLLDNLFWSLIAAFLIIGLQMALLFNSWRIMALSLIPNLIPLLLTAGIMGFLGIALKPSTALIYEMAFGIAIDNTIHYLAMYRHFRRQGLEVEEAVHRGLRTTGMGIVYTSVVLFMGFIIFTPSAFGSTQNLGILTSVTLFVAMFSNLFLMPALLISFDRRGRLNDRAMIDEAEEVDGKPAYLTPTDATAEQELNTSA
jgi:hypothetical protein